MRLRNIPGARDIIAISGFVVQEPEKKKGNWNTVFGNDHPIELEIGIGKGRFLMDLAERHPEKNFIGIEMYSSVLLRAIQRAEQRSTGAAEPLPVRVTKRPALPENCNFRLLRFDAVELPQLFAKGEIEKIYLNFSDPWPKDRHADRRLTSLKFLKRYEQVLKTGGELACKTDNQALFDFSLEQIRQSGWKLLFSTSDLHHTEQAEPEDLLMTEYEEKFVAAGQPIYMLKAQCR